jgi:fructose 1,6-bisphosphate aldolase/phosphatase
MEIDERPSEPIIVFMGDKTSAGSFDLPLYKMFDDPAFDNARAEANHIADYLRKHGPFEPHRLPLEEMEYTTMPVIAKKLGPRWQPMA